MFVAVLIYGLIAILAVWTLISPTSVYWVLTAWQHRNPEANEPSDAAYLASRIGAAVTLLVLVVTGAQLGGASVRAQAQEDCETVLLPALKDVVRKRPVEREVIETFAADHGLTLEVAWVSLPPYNPPSWKPRATSTPTNGSATSTPSAPPVTSPTVSASPTSPPRTTQRALVTYSFQRDDRTILTYIDDTLALSTPLLQCHG